jgi:hypothetical protein
MNQWDVDGSGDLWKVQRRDLACDAEMLTVFHGPSAEARAKAYCHWMNEPDGVFAEVEKIRKEMHAITAAISRVKAMA